MNKSLLNNLTESKKRFRKKLAKLPYEEKVKIVVELQKINFEMRKMNPHRSNSSIQKVWQI